MRIQKKEILKAIHALQYVVAETLTIFGKTENAKEHLRVLRELGLVQEIHQKGKSKADKRAMDKKVYALTAEGYEYIGKPGYKTPKYKAWTKFEHQSQLINSLMGIYWHYRNEYRFEIEYHSQRAKPRPDAIIKMTHTETGLVYHFIVELERTRTPFQIIKQKTSLENGIIKKFGLHDKTKILYIFNTDEGNEYETERAFNTLMFLAKDLPDHYRFLPYYNWRLAHKGEWFKPSLEKVNLINQ